MAPPPFQTWPLSLETELSYNMFTNHSALIRPLQTASSPAPFFYRFEEKNTTTTNIQIHLSVPLTAGKDSKSTCPCYERHLQ